jgi:hypothetical protein
MNPITPQFRPVPIIPGNGTHDPLNNNLISMSDGATSSYGLGIQNNNLYGLYDRGSSSYSDPPSTLRTNQSGSSLRRTPQVHHEPQTLSMMTDRPPIYNRNPFLDESAPVSSSSSTNGKIIESGRSQIPAKTRVAQPDELTSTAIPGRRKENASNWDSGYSQPLKFVSVL